jgi:hypothetical protein
MQRWPDTFILTRALQSTKPKSPQSLRRSTDRPDKRTAPPVPLRMLCHSTVRLTAAKSGLERHRKLHLARPQGSNSGSAPEDDELRLARPQGSDSALASADSLRLARPRGSDSTSASKDRLDLDLGGASALPNPGLGPTTS